MREPVSDRFWSKVKRGRHCWGWVGPVSDNGYGRFRYSGRHWGAHRLAWIFSVGEIPSGMHVLHKCDNRKCANPSHLWLGTHQDNIDDRERKQRNRPPRGERQPMHVLTAKDVKQIRALASEKRPTHLLADLYKVSRTTIWCILKRKTWRHI